MPRKYRTRQEIRHTKLDDIGFLYIIRLELGQKSFVKIGRTNNPRKRLSSYNQALPIDLYSYSYVSEKMYNISALENNLILFTDSFSCLARTEGRLEWYRINKRNKQSMSLTWHIDKIINKIQEYEDGYYEE